MKKFVFFLLGIFFGIIMIRSEAVSWFRIYEMFRFESFHMYGIIGSAVVTGIIGIQIIKRFKLKDFFGIEITMKPKDGGFIARIVGGTIFGLGWALSGACPGPIFVSIGAGIWPMIIVLIGAFLGTIIYGYFKEKLPH